MTTARQFVDRLERENEALFRASEMQVEAFFKSNPSVDALVEHFAGRCANEYMNMVEVAQRLSKMSPGSDRRMMVLLAKQVLDEANHFDLVAQVIEKLTGRPLDAEALLRREKSGGQAKGARSLENAQEGDALALHAYQFIAEGRAHRVWAKMAEVSQDPFIAATYKKISEDEKFHREIGRIGLEKLLESPENRERVLELADRLRFDLYEVSCMNCVEVAEARSLCVEAYGSRYLKH